MQLSSLLMPMALVTCLAHQSLVASAVIVSTSSQYYYLVVFFNMFQLQKSDCVHLNYFFNWL